MFEITPELKKEIYFVIPAYNEASKIYSVISSLKKEGYFNIIVIDDGSKDQTYEIARNSLKHVLKHPKNIGQGGALRTGINYAINQPNCKYIVTFDSDGQHRISDLPKLIKPLYEKKSDIVLGSRFLLKETRKLIPLKKKILLKGGVFVTWLLSGIWLTDTHNGYRAMTKYAALKIKITMNGFEHASEIIDEISRKKLRYREVPVFIDYTSYSKAKGQKISNAFRIFFKMLKRKFK